MLVFPNSKINLGLRVLDKRADGFHNIDSVFYPIPYHDILEVVPSKSGADKYVYSGLSIPGNEGDNLCAKAVRLMREEFQIPFVEVHLHKHVAMGAGLGGGSADAAYLISVLNSVFELNLTTSKLEALALNIGSDCPFFIENKPVKVKGRGEDFAPTHLDLTGKYLVLVLPGIHISTGEAYGNIQRSENATLPTEAVDQASIGQWKELLLNDFEGYAFKAHPVLSEIKDSLCALGAEYASMTGSGSAMYGIFESKPNMEILEKFGQIWDGQL